MEIKIFFLAILCIGSLLTDLKENKIKNYIVYPFLFGGIVLNFILAGWLGMLDSLLGIFIPFIILIIFFIIKILGAGDIKLLMSIGSIAGYHDGLTILIYSILAGGIISLIIMVFRKNSKDRFSYFYQYLKSCFISKTAPPYTEKIGYNKKSVFRFSFAILVGFLTFTFSL